MTTSRWVIWAAVSSIPQLEGYSLDTQLDEGRKHAAKWGGSILAELVVDGDSRNIVEFYEARQRIPEYQQLYDHIQARDFDVLCFRNRGRLGRDAALSMQVISYCRRAGILCYDLERPPHNLDVKKWNVSDEIVGAIRSVTFEDETHTLRQHHYDGMTRRTLAGHPPGGERWGWIIRYEQGDDPGKQPNKVYDVDPVAQAALLILADEYLTHGQGARKVAERLQALGYPAPQGMTWHKNTVIFIISRAHLYAGWVEMNRKSLTGREYVRAKSAWPALISEELASQLQAEQLRRRSAHRGVGSPLRLSGCVWCEICGRRRPGSTRIAKGKKEHQRYPMVGYECKEPRHKGGYISEKKIIALLRRIFQQLQDESQQANILEYTPDNTDFLRGQISRVEDEIAQVRTALVRVDDRYADGVLDEPRYTRQVARLNGQIAGLYDQIAGLQTELQMEIHASKRINRLAETANEGPAMLDLADIPTANAWLRAHIRVRDDGQEITIDFL